MCSSQGLTTTDDLPDILETEIRTPDHLLASVLVVSSRAAPTRESSCEPLVAGDGSDSTLYGAASLSAL